MRKSLKPSPPFPLGSIIFSHARQCVFHWPCLEPHQKFLTNRVRSSHTEYGNLNTPIMYVGIACKTDLINVSFPACERVSPHAMILLVNLACNIWNFPLCMRPSGVGKPRYFPSNSVFCTCNSCLTTSWTAAGQVSPNWMEHFSGLMSWPVAFAYLLITFLTYVAWAAPALKKSRVSSANNKCDIPGARLQIFIGWKAYASTPFLNSADSSSATKRNRKGDRGSIWMVAIANYKNYVHCWYRGRISETCLTKQMP